MAPPLPALAAPGSLCAIHRRSMAAHHQVLEVDQTTTPARDRSCQVGIADTRRYDISSSRQGLGRAKPTVSLVEIGVCRVLLHSG